MNPLQAAYDEDQVAVELRGFTFYVLLPGPSNKRFQRASLSRMATRGDDGEFTQAEQTMEDMVNAQLEAFAHTCVKRVDGWDDFTPEQLLEVPEALEDLWTECVKLATDREEVALTAVGK